MKKLELYKRSSLVSADTPEAVEAILIRKAEEYNFSEAKLLDYIGNSLNDMQSKINELTYQKSLNDMQLKQAKANKQDILNLIALGLESLGLDSLKDKSSEVLSSLSVTEATEATEELKQRKLTQKEMEDILKGYGESLYITEEVQTEAKEKTIKANFKRGVKVAELKPKDATSQIVEKYKLEE